MKVLTIGSSSSGNATLVFNATARILIDAGVAVKTVIEKTGMDKFDACFVSHEHGDHIKSAGALGRKTKVPIYINNLVYEDKQDLFKNCTIVNVDGITPITIGDMTVQPFSTKHDAKFSLGFTISDSTGKLCYLTDTGSISKVITNATKDCTTLFIECDYDEESMKEFTGYDDMLKARITSDYGHLSTQQTLEFIGTFDLDKIRNVIIGHLSSNTNSPELVRQRIQARFPKYVAKFHVAPLDYTLDV